MFNNLILESLKMGNIDTLHILSQSLNHRIIPFHFILTRYKKQKKTLVDSLERNNNPNTSYWFRGQPEIFSDYLVIGADGEVCFCFSKKHEYDNPSIYICENPNSNKDVDFERLNLDLNGLISVMIEEEFE